jgi:hypothetical protein
VNEVKVVVSILKNEPKPLVDPPLQVPYKVKPSVDNITFETGPDPSVALFNW